MFLIEGLYSLLGSGLNLTWTGSIRRTLRGAYRLCRSMLVISADLLHQALWVLLLSAAVQPAEYCLRCIIGGCTVFTVARLLLQAPCPHDTRLGDWPLMCPTHGQFRHTLPAVTWCLLRAFLVAVASACPEANHVHGLLQVAKLCVGRGAPPGGFVRPWLELVVDEGLAGGPIQRRWKKCSSPKARMLRRRTLWRLPEDRHPRCQ